MPTRSHAQPHTAATLPPLLSGRGGPAPPSQLTVDRFQIFCFAFAGKWSPELWFGFPRGKSILPLGQHWSGLTGCLLASGPPLQYHGAGWREAQPE